LHRQQRRLISACRNGVAKILDAKTGGYKIEVGLDPKSYNLMTLTLTDQLGDVTRIDFSDIHDNVELSDSTFAFKTPAGADVVTAPASP